MLVFNIAFDKMPLCHDSSEAPLSPPGLDLGVFLSGLSHPLAARTLLSPFRENSPHLNTKLPSISDQILHPLPLVSDHPDLPSPRIISN